MIETLIPAAIGALFALGGVWLQNRHDARQRERERKMTMRRDVYLAAAEGLSGFQQYLASFANPDADIGNSTSVLTASPGWQNKVHVVASLPTIRALSAADSYFVAALLELFPLRHQIEELKREADSFAQRRTQAGQAKQFLYSTLQAEVRKVEESGEMPPPGIVQLVENLKSGISKAQADEIDLGRSEAECHEKRGEAVLSLLKLVIQKSAHHRLLVAKANLELRREMELDLDSTEYLQVIESGTEEVIAAFDRTFGSSRQ